MKKRILLPILGVVALGAVTIANVETASAKVAPGTDGKACPNINTGPCCEGGSGSCGATVEL
ncbi:exported hypothetical protein [Tenacibaculum maritimum]|uniref:hypothetical protein n=1 Tax=Tenacibaculum maritimum TaxID=107401 RepID=UPI0012E4737A|nr:hypothetical protein [Tenacibaculum maritimum]MCD9609498.1 hypothetical protein [Tenacibaculum maritimum]CAA0152016.1 exported hypothetical protein [Tenacibaculum maritimum]